MKNKKHFVSLRFNLASKMGQQLTRSSTSLTRGRKIVVLKKKKNVVPRTIKPKILKLTIRRDQSTFNVVFTFVSCDEKYYYAAMLAGQFQFPQTRPANNNTAKISAPVSGPPSQGKGLGTEVAKI